MPSSIKSVETNVPSDRTSLSSVNPPSRRNRAALLDYYGISSNAATDTRNSSRSSSVDAIGSKRGGGSGSQLDAETETNSNLGDGKENESSQGQSPSLLLDALDAPDFDVESFKQSAFETKDLSSLLAMARELRTGIRALDGERKALVYDNYSKLITATDTIKKMQKHMDPLVPAMATLDPTISHIAKLATELSSSPSSTEQSTSAILGAGQPPTKQAQIEAVQWILRSPKRLERHFCAHREGHALREWDLIQTTLQKWNMPSGSSELLAQCKAVIDEHASESNAVG